MANFKPRLVAPRDRIKILKGAKEAAAQSFVEGNFVGWVSGAITESTPGDPIIGMAKETASGTTSAEVAVQMIESGDLVELSTVDSNDSNNPVDASTFVQGEAYGLLNLSSVHCADIYDTTNQDFIFLYAVDPLNGGTSYRGVFAVKVGSVFSAASMNFIDDQALTFGTGTDYSILYDGSNLVMTAAATDGWLIGGDTYNINATLKGTLTVGKDDTGHDVKFFGATASSYWMWDESADAMLIVGDSTLTGTLTVGVDDTGHDVKFFGATASSYMLWDESADKLIINAGTADLGTSCEADAYTVGGTAGADFNGAVTNLTAVKGIVTAAS